MKQVIKNSINKLPYIRTIYSQLNFYRKNSLYPPGHFYSPIVSIDNIKGRESEIWKFPENEMIEGIDLRNKEQLELLQEFIKFYADLPFKSERQPNLRYSFDNNFYSYTDAIILYSMIRKFRPQRIIEIGSGFSSAVMLDTNQLFFENSIYLTFIEPEPNRLYSLLTKKDKETNNVLVKNVQSVQLKDFENLEKGDILFIDSSHIAKTGSDLNYILFEILPCLNSGVLIHFHDIFYPFEYPKSWVFSGRNLNEDYFLKAFLMYNNKFRIRFFSHYLHKFHKESFNKMPLCNKNEGGNIWLEKV